MTLNMCHMLSTWLIFTKFEVGKLMSKIEEKFRTVSPLKNFEEGVIKMSE